MTPSSGLTRVDQIGLQEIRFQEFEFGMGANPLQIFFLHPTGVIVQETIDPDYLMPPPDQGFGQVGPDESGGAGYQYFHFLYSLDSYIHCSEN